MVDESFWKNKKVFLTGHTGFKGSWLSLWLLKMGAKVVGYSKDIPTSPSLFEELNLKKDMQSITGNVCDVDFLKKSLIESKSEIIIHMAAQPLVRYSYENPVETYMTNVMGVVHLLNSAREASSTKVILNVTSDKCYENFEREAGYKEDEPMGGFDPYSNSKGCSELVTSSFRKSYFANTEIGLGTGRAGNVIGGGDWSNDRLVPDIVRSVINKTTLDIRFPYAIRPWQHVLEPLSGYLTHIQKMYNDPKKFSKSYNFGPKMQDHCNVEMVIQKLNHYWNNEIKYKINTTNANPHEAHYLKLNCDRAKSELNWTPKWSFDQSIEKIVQWNRDRMNGSHVREITMQQLSEYVGAHNE